MSSMNIVESYVSSKIIIGESQIHGRGMIAKKRIKKGEVVFIKGGHIVTRNELFSSRTINSYLPIDDNFFIGARNEEEEERIKLYLNHSCDPTCGLRGEITFVALREIYEDEELTCDYAMIDNEDYGFDCTCGSDVCRKRITGFDWKIKELQSKYANHFAQYLLDKMRNNP